MAKAFSMFGNRVLPYGRFNGFKRGTFAEKKQARNRKTAPVKKETKFASIEPV